MVFAFLSFLHQAPPGDIDVFACAGDMLGECFRSGAV